jgi:hypothetical protein
MSLFQLLPNFIQDSFFYSNKLQLYKKYYNALVGHDALTYSGYIHVDNCGLNSKCYKKYLDLIDELHLKTDDLKELINVGSTVRDKRDNINDYWYDMDVITDYYDNLPGKECKMRNELAEVEKVLQEHNLQDFIKYKIKASL